MFRLDNILEKWAQAYRPLSHDPAAKSTRRTFFRISMIDAQSYFVRNYNTQPSPCCAYATHVDAEIDKRETITNYNHVVYFLVKQENSPGRNDVTDELAAAEARYRTDDMVQDLLAFLSALSTAANSGKTELEVGSTTFHITDDIRQGLRGLQLDKSHWGTLPTHFNGWQICGLTISQLVPRLKCVTTQKYI